MSYQINLQWKALSPLLPGSGRDHAAADLLVARRSDGAALLRGSALAGVLRAHATRIAPLLGEPTCVRIAPPDNDSERDCPCAVCLLFGPARITDRRRDQAHQSWLLVDDAALRAPTRVRDGVAIARATGAADRAAAAKFDYEYFSAGVTIEARLRFAPRPGAMPEQLDRGRRLLRALLIDLERQDAISFGHGHARGMGRVELCPPVTVRNLRPGGASALRERLSQGVHGYTGVPATLDDLTPAADVLARVATDAPPVGALTAWVRLELTLKSEGGVLVNDPVAAARTGFDAAPDWTGAHADARAVLDGASVRGVLRARAERFARSLWQWQTPGGPADPATCPACHPTTGSGRGDRDLPLVRCSLGLDLDDQDRGRRLKPAEELERLCPACRLFGSTRAGSRLVVAAGAADAPHAWKPLEHLAIDRFTGGGRDRLKFDAWVAWEPRFTVALYLENPRAWEIDWLLSALPADGEDRLFVGARSAEGLGWFHLTSAAITSGWAGSVAPSWAPAATGRHGVFHTSSVAWTPGNPLPNELQSVAGSLRSAIATFRRPPAASAAPSPSRDTIPPERRTGADGMSDRQRAVYLAGPLPATVVGG